MTGLVVYVYRAPALSDMSNEGLSHRCTRLCVVNVEGPFEPTDSSTNLWDIPAVLLIDGVLVPAVRGGAAVWEPKPADAGMLGPFNGGNIAYVNDPRWFAACNAHGIGPVVPIHDRFEQRHGR